MLLLALSACTKQGAKVSAQGNTTADSACLNRNNGITENEDDITLTSCHDHLIESKGQQQFTIAVYNEISQASKGNTVCSPLGMEALYSMFRAGAKGGTYDELNLVLGISSTDVSFITKDMQLPSAPSSTTVSMANLIVVNKQYAVNPPYAAGIKKNYGAEIWSRAFNPTTISEINKWIARKTHGMIRDGIDGLDGIMCGVNTIYFNGQWAEPFDKKKTRPTVFTCLNGKKVKVSMMSQRYHCDYLKAKTFQAIAMPYRPRESKNAKMRKYSLYVFLPLPGKGLSTINDYLKRNTLAAIRQEMADYGIKHFNTPQPIVNIKIPRLEISQEIDVTSVMKALGVKTAFGGNADFSNIVSTGGISIGHSKQKAAIRIDEEGTEAAAMTESAVVGAYEGQVATRPKEAFFYANRPFLYMIACEDTNTILFIGQYANGKIQKGGAWKTDTDLKGADTLIFTEDIEFKEDARNEDAKDYTDARNEAVPQMKDEAGDPNMVYDVVEVMPRFPGGNTKLMEYVKEKQQYPAAALKDKIEGRVVVSFVVETNGEISNVKVRHSPHPSLDKEAERIIKSMPRWHPGIQNGRIVRVKYYVPVIFILPQHHPV